MNKKPVAIKRKAFIGQEEMATHINKALSSVNPQDIAISVGDLFQFCYVERLAEAAGVSRATFYRQFRHDGKPSLTAFLGAMQALGLEVTVSVKQDSNG